MAKVKARVMKREGKGEEQGGERWVGKGEGEEKRPNYTVLYNIG